jgi:hypothetical protein
MSNGRDTIMNANKKSPAAVSRQRHWDRGSLDGRLSPQHRPNGRCFNRPSKKILSLVKGVGAATSDRT